MHGRKGNSGRENNVMASDGGVSAITKQIEGHGVPVWVGPGSGLAVGPGHHWRWQGSWCSGWRPTVGSHLLHVP